ncbi:hypothetical protein ABZP36_027467 [Zizania latifolia]
MEPVVSHDQRPVAIQRLLKPSHAMDHTERRFMCHVAFAVVVGHRPASLAAHVKHRLTEYLRIQSSDIKVSSHLSGSFLVFFSRVEDHSVVLSENRLPLRGLELKLIPWSRRVQASFAKMRFRARLCVEGLLAMLVMAMWLPSFSLKGVSSTRSMMPPPPKKKMHAFVFGCERRMQIKSLTVGFLSLDNEGEPFFNYSPYNAISGLDSPVSFENEVPHKSTFLWELRVVDGSALPSWLPVRERLGGYRDRSRSRDCSRSPSPRREDRARWPVT